MSANREPNKVTGPICQNGANRSVHESDAPTSSALSAELGELLAALREDVLTPEQAQRLMELLRESADARRTYLHHMNLMANLVQSGADARSGCAVVYGRRRTVGRRRRNHR